MSQNGPFCPICCPGKEGSPDLTKIPVVTRSACIDIERDFSSVKEVGGNHFPFWPLGYTHQDSKHSSWTNWKKGSCPSRPRPFSGLTPSIWLLFKNRKSKEEEKKYLRAFVSVHAPPEGTNKRTKKRCPDTLKEGPGYNTTLSFMKR